MEENHTSATALSKLANSCGVVENVIVHEVSFFYNLQGSVDLVAVAFCYYGLLSL